MFFVTMRENIKKEMMGVIEHKLYTDNDVCRKSGKCSQTNFGVQFCYLQNIVKIKIVTLHSFCA